MRIVYENMARQKRVVTAAEIKAQWEAKEKGQDINAIAIVADTLNENDTLKDKVAQLEEDNKQLTKKSKYSPSALRQRLDETLAGFGINAAFEPLIELATERFPKDYHDEKLRGAFVCTVDQRIKIWTELLSYQLPKLKAVEVAGQVDNSITVLIRRFGDDAILERGNSINERSSSTPPIDITPVAEKPCNDTVTVKKF